MTTSAPDYGMDLSCTTDIDPRMVEVSGLEGFAQALARRLDTPASTLVDDDDGTYGYDLALLLSLGLTRDERALIPARIEGQFLEDERTRSVAVDVQVLTDSEIRLFCRVVAVDLGPFSFVLAIDKVGRKLLNITAGA